MSPDGGQAKKRGRGMMMGVKSLGGTGVRSTKVRIGPQVGVEEGKNEC